MFLGEKVRVRLADRHGRIIDAQAVQHRFPASHKTGLLVFEINPVGGVIHHGVQEISFVGEFFIGGAVAGDFNFEPAIGLTEFILRFDQAAVQPLGGGTGFHLHPGNAKEHQGKNQATRQRGQRQVAFRVRLKRRQGGKAQAPGASKYGNGNGLAEKWTCLFRRTPTGVKKIFRSQFRAVEDFDGHRRSPAPGKRSVEQLFWQEGAGDETLQRRPPLGAALDRCPRLEDRRENDEAMDEIGAIAGHHLHP